MRRVFVVLPNEVSCKAVVDELLELGIARSHLHVVAGLSHKLEDLPEAGVWQKTELAHGIEWGVGLGGIAGLLGGLLAVTFPPGGIVLGGGAVLAASAAGAGMGGVVTALLGSQEHNHQLDVFHQAIAAGEVILMVDVPKRQVDQVGACILGHHPEAKIQDVARPAGS